jgi:hypothetical protein
VITAIFLGLFVGLASVACNYYFFIKFWLSRKELQTKAIGTVFLYGFLLSEAFLLRLMLHYFMSRSELDMQLGSLNYRIYYLIVVAMFGISVIWFIRLVVLKRGGVLKIFGVK